MAVRPGVGVRVLCKLGRGPSTPRFLNYFPLVYCINYHATLQ